MNRSNPADASPAAARIAVSIQMILDVLVLGIGVRILVGAVQLGRQRVASDTAATAALDGENADRPG